MICAKVLQEDKEDYLFLFPEKHVDGLPCAGVLGGTFSPDFDKLSPTEQRTLDEQELKLLLDRDTEFFHGNPYEES